MVYCYFYLFLTIGFSLASLESYGGYIQAQGSCQGANSFIAYIQKAELVDDDTQSGMTSNLLGTGIGALAGGFLGAKVTDSVPGALVGGVAGGFLGSVIENQIKNPQIVRYTIVALTGNSYYVTQSADQNTQPLTSGQRVCVSYINGTGGNNSVSLFPM
jgi:outer membrane lipoprotein SlyB